MTAPQTSVSTPDIGVPGQVLNLHTSQSGKISSATSEEASASIPFGVMVKGGTADRTAKNLAANSDVLKGIAMWSGNYHRDLEVDENGLRPGCTFDVLEVGETIVRVEDAVTPASEVHVRAVIGGANGYGAAGAETKGAFRGTADGADTIDISAFAKYISSADAGGIAKISIDMRNSALQAADS